MASLWEVIKKCSEDTQRNSLLSTVFPKMLVVIYFLRKNIKFMLR